MSVTGIYKMSVVWHDAGPGCMVGCTSRHCLGSVTRFALVSSPSACHSRSLLFLVLSKYSKLCGANCGHAPPRDIILTRDVHGGKSRLKSWTLRNGLSEGVMGQGLAAPAPPGPPPTPGGAARQKDVILMGGEVCDLTLGPPFASAVRVPLEAAQRNAQPQSPWYAEPRRVFGGAIPQSCAQPWACAAAVQRLLTWELIEDWGAWGGGVGPLHRASPNGRTLLRPVIIPVDCNPAPLRGTSSHHHHPPPPAPSHPPPNPRTGTGPHAEVRTTAPQICGASWTRRDLSGVCLGSSPWVRAHRHRNSRAWPTPTPPHPHPCARRPHPAFEAAQHLPIGDLRGLRPLLGLQRPRVLSKEGDERDQPEACCTGSGCLMVRDPGRASFEQGRGRGGGGFGPKTWCTKNGLTRFSLL